MHYCWWKFPLWHYRTLHSGNSSVEISTDIPEHSVNVWINPPICLHGVDVSTSQWINPPGNAVKCINPLPIFIFHHLVDIYINLGTSVGYTTLLYQVPPSSGIVHSYSTLCSDSVSDLMFQSHCVLAIVSRIAFLQNAKQFNGAYGCGWCLQRRCREWKGHGS